MRATATRSRTLPPARRPGSAPARLGAAALAAIVLAGCGALPRNAVPPDLAGYAVIPGMPDVRAPAGRPSPAMADDLARSFAQESPQDFPVGPDGRARYPHLALSGGGPNGAFGAGILNGWTKTGRRPVFKIVTGVSTGALMAPFAFLGPKYDDLLREFYTTTTTRNIFSMLSIVPALLAGDSLADTAPLGALIARHVTPALLSEVAQAHEQGRRLYIGTVDLDSQRFIVWNMGLIATSGRPNALDLFRQVMLASSSVPVAFPPVFFDVEAQGARHDEMHVDGGVAAGVFLNGGVFSFSALRAAAGGAPGREEIFIVHNGQLFPVGEPTRRSVGAIALRVFSSAGIASTVGDLHRIYAVSLREDAGYHWITIPERTEVESREVFDTQAMTALYDLGFRTAMAGPAWRTTPPGLTDSPSPEAPARRRSPIEAREARGPGRSRPRMRSHTRRSAALPLRTMRAMPAPR